MRNKPRGWHSRGYLPHFDGGEIPQLVTFRLADSFPTELLQQWKQELKLMPPEKAEIERRERIESYLDQGRGEAFLKHPTIAEAVQEALLHFDGDRYRLHAWVVMPNHVHSLFTPMEGHLMSSILHSWKSYSAKEANRLLGQSGRFWQEDYFDRYIRNPAHFEAAIEYIELNPVTAALCTVADEWPYSSAARQTLTNFGNWTE